MELYSCSIITIGDELITGYRLDTNSKWLSNQLASLNVNVRSIISIGDNKRNIIDTLKSQLKYGLDYIFITGGLGPTQDDKTLDSMKYFLKTEYFIDEEYKAFLNKKVKRDSKYRKMVENQSTKIKGVEYFENLKGTAQPFSFLSSNTRLFVLPGVPVEMKSIFSNSILPIIKKKNEGGVDYTINTTGIGESLLFDRIETIIRKYSDCVKVGFLPSKTGVTLRLTSSLKYKTEIDKVNREIVGKIGNYYLGSDNVSLEEYVTGLLKKKKLTVSVAESCTGGLISKLLTDSPGSSAVFKGSVVCYSNNIKNKNLNIAFSDLEKYGAVSGEIAQQMSTNISNIMETDIGVSATGISGPSGGSKSKPLGLVFISIQYLNKVYTEKFIFSRDRENHREVTANTALNMLRLIILDKWKKK